MVDDLWYGWMTFAAEEEAHLKISQLALASNQPVFKN